MSNSEWWQGLPRWLKLIYAFVAIPAWLVIGFCVLTGQAKSSLALSAFGVFAAVIILNLIFDRRKGLIGGEGGGVDFGGGGD